MIFTVLLIEIPITNCLSLFFKTDGKLYDGKFYWIILLHTLGRGPDRLLIKNSIVLRDKALSCETSKSILLTVPRRCFFGGSFLLGMLHVGVCCAVVSIPCSLVVTCWERAYLLAVAFVVFCHFPKCVLVHIRNKGEVGPAKLV